MYKVLKRLKLFLEEKVCSKIQFKRLEYDEKTENEIYQVVNPEVFLFDETINYKESKMPYINIQANSKSYSSQEKIECVLKIMTKNDGVLTWKYDDEGNQLMETNFEPNDFSAYEDCLAIAEKCRMELLLSNDFVIKPGNDGLLFELKVIQAEYTGNGIACVELYFDIYTYPQLQTIDKYLSILQ